MDILTAKEKKLVDSILDALIALEPDTPAEVNEELRAMGYDPDKMNKRVKKFVQIALEDSNDGH